MSRLTVFNRGRITPGDGGDDNEAVQQALAGPRNDDWSHAVENIGQCVRAGHNSRQVWLYLASAYERAGQRERARQLTSITNDLFPADAYDAKQAFGVHPDAPAERDAMAQFLHANITQLRESALKAMQPKPTGRRIYMYWDSEPPPLVSTCFDAARANVPADYELVMLDAESAGRMAPDAVRLGAAASLTKAQLSDVIRTHLLADRGGLWMDATVLVNRRFPAFLAEISELDFFLFTYRGSRTGSWFWWAEPTSYRLQLIRAALDLWLSAGLKWSNYFMFHDIVEMLYWVDDRYREEWNAGLPLHPRDALAMLEQLTKPVSDVVWADLQTRSPVSKLSWKFRADALNDPKTAASRLLGSTTP